MNYKIFPLLLLFIIPTQQIAHSQNIENLESTPSAISEPGATLLIKEINLKNSEFDWVKMLYFSPSEKVINLKGLSFQDDSKFKTIEEDIYIASGQELLLSFKSEQPDQPPYFYSSRSGLTGTTEQFIINDNLGNVLDAVCWTSSSPTESEIKDMSELYELEGWLSPDPSSCVFSEKIAKNESIIRFNLNDTDSSADWKTETELNQPEEIPQVNENTPPKTNTEVVETNNTINDTIFETTKNESPETTVPKQIDIINLNTDHLQKTKDNIESKSQKSSKNSNSTKSYANGDLSDAIIISEILPNPEGTDTKKEWIELCNREDDTVNLGNWTIDDIEEGSKPFKIPSDIILKAHACSIFRSEDTKLSLGNSEDEVHLLDYLGSEIDSMNYEGAPSGESYTKIQINKEDGSTEAKWIWTKEQSPNQPNTDYYELTLKITEPPVFDKKYYFEATDQKSNKYIVDFSEELISAPMAQATFTKNTIIKTLFTAVEENNNQLKLKQYEVIETGEETFETPLLLPAIICVILILSGSAFYLLKNKIPWQDIKENHNQQNE